MKTSTRQIPLDLRSRPALGRDDFLIGPANAEAVGWIDRWPNWPAPALILSGPAASGKTHLAAVWRDRAKAVMVSPDLLLAGSAQDIAAMGSSLVLDGLDPWLGERDAETVLFHLYNIFKEEVRSLLLTMRMAPAQIDFALPDLASRLRAAPVAQIHPPDDELLAAILIKMFHDRQLSVQEEIIRYVLPRMERSFAAARDIVERTDNLTLAEKRGISMPIMRRVLADMQSAADG